MPRATFVVLVGAAMCFASADIAIAQSRPPNFIIIFTDDQGYADLGSFGHPTSRAPHLDVANEHPTGVADVQRIAAAHKSTVKLVPTQLEKRITR